MPLCPVKEKDDNGRFSWYTNFDSVCEQTENWSGSRAGTGQTADFPAALRNGDSDGVIFRKQVRHKEKEYSFFQDKKRLRQKGTGKKGTKYERDPAGGEGDRE